jgi:hypothetical protein
VIKDIENDYIRERDHISREKRKRKKRIVWKATPVTVDPPLEDVCPHT